MNSLYIGHLTRFLARWFDGGSDPEISKKFAMSLKEFSNGRGI